MPSDLIFLGRCVAILSGICTGLEPDFNLFQELAPFAQSLVSEEGGDWLRAAQFADVFFEWSRASRMPAFPGTCQLHRAAVLGVQGELERAAGRVLASTV